MQWTLLAGVVLLLGFIAYRRICMGIRAQPVIDLVQADPPLVVYPVMALVEGKVRGGGDPSGFVGRELSVGTTTFRVGTKGNLGEAFGYGFVAAETTIEIVQAKYDLLRPKGECIRICGEFGGAQTEINLHSRNKQLPAIWNSLVAAGAKPA